jgi:cytochrome c
LLAEIPVKPWRSSFGTEASDFLTGFIIGFRDVPTKIGERDMTKGTLVSAIGAALLVAMLGRPATAEGELERGAKAFRKCVACHSVEKGHHKTGPSLAEIWGRKAGTVDGFRRYSDALKKSGVTWTKRNFDEWLRSPRTFIPGNRMTIPGIKDKKERDDLLAYLKSVATGGAPQTARRGGMMGGRRMLNLKELGTEQQVKSIRYCDDTYTVTTFTGQVLEFWEFNLRFKSDSSANGPARGTPVLTRSGMMGDRAFVVFVGPEEFSPFIERTCR